MKSPVIIKKNGARQRSDVQLTKELAGTLVQRILSGETLYPPEGKLELLVGDAESEKTVFLNVCTLQQWVKRNNVIPETGVTLRDLLNDAREEYRTRMRKEMDRERQDIIDAKLNRVLALRTNEPVVGMFGLIKDKDGKIVRKENPHLLRIQADTIKWLAERLYPDRYGKVEKTENKHLVFSLADLRRAKQERDATMSEVPEA